MITGSVFFNAAAEQIRWVGLFVGFLWWTSFSFLSFFPLLVKDITSVGARRFSRANVKSQWNGSMN